MNWPNPAEEYLKGQESTGSWPAQLLSPDCLLEAESGIKLYYTKLLGFAFLPILLLLGVALFWGIYALIKKQMLYLKYHFVGTLVVVIFLFHPTILKFMLSAFSCIELEPGEYWLNDDTDIRCWDSEHLFYAISVALPGLIVWGLVVPTMLIVPIIRSRHNLNDPASKVRFGLLIFGYRSNRYYWEFVVLYRKIIIVFVSVFFAGSDMIQGLIALFVLTFCFYVQEMKQPFE